MTSRPTWSARTWMSTDDTPAATTQARRRRVPADPSEDELARHWSLMPADLAVVAECRGPDHRRRFALQVCAMRLHGRFLDDCRHAPIKIVNHLSRQPRLAPVLFLDRAGREPTGRVQAQRIRRYRAVRRFDKAAEASLRDWLRAGALEGRARHACASGVRCGHGRRFSLVPAMPHARADCRSGPGLRHAPRGCRPAAPGSRPRACSPAVCARRRTERFARHREVRQAPRGSPDVAPGHRHPEHAAHHRHGPAAAVLLDGPEPYRDGCAKMAIPFLSMSRSIRSRSTSRLSRAIPT